MPVARRPRRRGEWASESLEFVVATPALLLTLMLVVTLGLWQYAQHVAEAAAHEAAVAASLQQATAADGQAQGSAALQRMGASLIVSPRVTVVRGADTVRADVSADVARLIPFLQLSVHAVDTENVERFVPAP